MISIKRNSSTHLLLSYLKVVSGKPKTVADIRAFSPEKFKDVNKIKKSLNVLISHGYISQQNNCYNITPQGVLALRQIVLEQKAVDK